MRLMSAAMSSTSSASDFCTRTNALWRPLYSLTRSTSAKPSRTVATSPKRKMAPSGLARSTMFSNSSPRRRLVLVRSSRSPASVRNSPEERFSDDSRTGVCDKAHIQVVAAQRLLAYLYRDLVVAHANQRYEGDSRQRQEGFFQSFRAAYQLRLGQFGRHDQRHHVAQLRGAFHLGLFGVFGRKLH